MTLPARALMSLALFSNAVFSLCVGAGFILEWPFLAGFEAELPVWFRVALGWGLVAFALGVGHTAFRPKRWAVLLISIMDIGWVATTLPLTAVPGLFGPETDRLVIVCAAIVAVFAVLQLLALRAVLLDREGPGRYRHCLKMAVGATPHGIWNRIADLPAISRYSDNVASSALRGDGDAGAGAVRDCADTAGRRWSEEVIRFDSAERELVLRFLTEAPDFPYPISEMTGGWRVRPGPAGAEVEVWWSLTPTVPGGWLLIAAMTFGLDRDMLRVLRRMAGEIDGDMTVKPVRAGRAARLGFC